MPTNTRPGMDRTIYETSETLTVGQTAGNFLIQIPFDVEYIAVYNPTAAAITYAEGQLSQEPVTAVTVQPELAISTELNTARRVTVWWNSQTAIPAPTAEQPNRVNFMFSNEPIQLQVAAINTGQSNNVAVTNQPDVIAMGSPNNGTNVYVLKTDASGNLQAIPLVGGNPVTTANPLPINVENKPYIALSDAYGGGGAGEFGAAGSGISDNNNGVSTLLVAPTAWNGGGYDRIKVATPGCGVQATTYSGTATAAVTASVAVKASPGVVGTLINTGAAVSPTITVYDNASAASGTQLFNGTLAAGQVLPLGLPAASGIYVTLSAAGTITVSYA